MISGRCTNFDYCTTADSRRDLPVYLDSPVCPECKKPLKIKLTRLDKRLASLGSAPPRLAAQLVCLAVPHDRQQQLLGDLEEVYREEWLSRFGARMAVAVYWLHVVQSVLAYNRAIFLAFYLVEHLRKVSGS